MNPAKAVNFLLTMKVYFFQEKFTLYEVIKGLK